MAICGTCNNVVPRNWRKKIDRTVSGVCFRRLLSEYFDYSPQNPVVCLQCDHVLEQIVKLNLKLEKLTLQRNTIISDFGAKISHTKILSEDGLAKGAERVSPKQVSTTESSVPEEGSQPSSQSSRLSSFPEMKVEPLEDETEGYESGHDSNKIPSKTSRVKHEPPLARRTRRSTRQQQPPLTRNHPHPVHQQKQDEDDVVDNNSSDDEEADNDDENNSDAARPDDDDEDDDSIRDPPQPPPPPTVDIKAESEVNGDAFIYSQSQRDEPFHCALCKRKFASAEGLSRHMDTLHRAKLRKTAQCGKCSKRCRDTATLVAHLEEFHTRSNKRCMVCGKVCSDKFNYLAHMKVHRLNHEKRVGAVIGEAPYQGSNSALLHPSSPHGQENGFSYNASSTSHPFASERAENSADEQTVPNGEYKEVVDRAVKSSSAENSKAGQVELVFSMDSERTLQYHDALNEREESANEGPYATESKAKSKHKRPHNKKTLKAGRKPSGRPPGGSSAGEKRLMCHICSKLCSQHMELKDHIRTHTGERPYHCDKCPKVFASKSNLRSHLKTHSGDKAYRCDQCSASFLFPNSLWAHQRSAHSEARPYACKECGATFKLPTHLKRHMFLHTGEKPFKCELCPATFIQKGNMKIHMKVHNKANHQRAAPLDGDRAQAPPPSLQVPLPSSRPALSGSAPTTNSGSHPPYPCPLPPPSSQSLSCGISGAGDDLRKGVAQGPGSDNSLSSQVSGAVVSNGSDHTGFMGGAGPPTGGVVMGYFPHLWTMVPSQHSPRH